MTTIQSVVQQASVSDHVINNVFLRRALGTLCEMQRRLQVLRSDYAQCTSVIAELEILLDEHTRVGVQR